MEEIHDFGTHQWWTYKARSEYSCFIIKIRRCKLFKGIACIVWKEITVWKGNLKVLRHFCLLCETKDEMDNIDTGDDAIIDRSFVESISCRTRGWLATSTNIYFFSLNSFKFWGLINHILFSHLINSCKHWKIVFMTGNFSFTSHCYCLLEAFLYLKIKITLTPIQQWKLSSLLSTRKSQGNFVIYCLLRTWFCQCVLWILDCGIRWLLSDFHDVRKLEPTKLFLI